MIWHVAFNITYKNGKTTCVEVVKDKYGVRFAQGDNALLSVALGLPKFNDLMTIFGYNFVSYTPEDINGYDFRLNMINTNGSIDVMASNDEIMPSITTNDLNVAIAELTSDVDFINYFVHREDLVLINTYYVDYDPNNDSSEAWNLIKTLQSFGRTITTFTDISASSLATKLARCKTFFVPELENDEGTHFIDDLTEDARNVIRNYVQNGGTFLQFNVGSGSELTTVNTLFGFTIQSTFGPPTIYNKTPQAIGSVLSSGPAYVEELNASNPVESSTLPPESISAYEANGDSAVFIAPYGSGRVIGLMVDWYDSAPYGFQDGGWVEVIRLLTQ